MGRLGRLGMMGGLGMIGGFGWTGGFGFGFIGVKTGGLVGRPGGGCARREVGMTGRTVPAGRAGAGRLVAAGFCGLFGEKVTPAPPAPPAPGC